MMNYANYVEGITLGYVLGTVVTFLLIAKHRRD